VQKKVLIVDDSPAQVKLIQGLLEPEGYWPVGLNDPRRVEEAIAMERPSVILLDVVMPERNGFQVCRELKSNAEFNSIPVILVTVEGYGERSLLGPATGRGRICNQAVHAGRTFASGTPLRLRELRRAKA